MPQIYLQNFRDRTLGGALLRTLKYRPEFPDRFGSLEHARGVSRDLTILGESGSEWDFALQPGGGVDVALSDAVALRFGVDVRVLFDKPFSGDSHNQLRFTTGVVFRTW